MGSSKWQSYEATAEDKVLQKKKNRKQEKPPKKKPTKKKQTKAYGNARSVDYINAVFS